MFDFGSFGGAIPSTNALESLSESNIRDQIQFSRAPSHLDGGGSKKVLLPSIPLEDDILENWRVVDQRPRNTCVAFAAAACAELLYARMDNALPEMLSPQFLYWMMRRRYGLVANEAPPGYQRGATRISQVLDVLSNAGICLESESPYHLATLNNTSIAGA